MMSIADHEVVSKRYNPREMLRILVIALALCAGGSAAEGPSDARGVRPAPAYRPATDMRQTMEWILDPAADVIWSSAGFVITAEGETNLAPTNLEHWDRVRNNAAILAEAGNLLMMPGRDRGPSWAAYAQGLTAASENAMAAAKARDGAALFDAGGQIYQVCQDCHAQYMIGARSSERLP
jgi:hypothetical protein